MKAKLEFDLDQPEEEQRLKNAINADRIKWKIDDLYTEVFRPFIKYDKGFISRSSLSNGLLPIRTTKQDPITYRDIETIHAVKIDVVDRIEQMVVEAIWDKVHKHFNEEE